MDCIFNGRIEYENHCLGWYPFQGQEYYFFDKTDFNGTKATTDREKMLFQSGNRNVYMQFLQDTVFPSTVLSLALTIGYSAVVVSRLRKEFDLGTIIVNLCGISSTGKSTAEMICKDIDAVSISLNETTSEKYDKITKNIFPGKAFDAMIDFTRQCVKYCDNVRMTVVDVIPTEEIEKARKICESTGAKFTVREFVPED